jgi:hypothetical protein
VLCGDEDRAERAWTWTLEHAYSGRRLIQTAVVSMELGKLLESKGQYQTAHIALTAAERILEEIGSARGEEAKRTRNAFYVRQVGNPKVQADDISGNRWEPMIESLLRRFQLR